MDKTKLKKLTYSISVNLVIVAMLGGLFALTLNNGVKSVFAPQSENLYYRGNSEQKCVSLMINVYWGNEYLPNMLKTLKDIKTGVTAQISQMNEITAGYHTGFRIAVETTSTVTAAWLTSGSPRLSWLVTGYIEDGESSNSD